MIYLDHNATTPIDERVLEVMLPFLSRFYGNPSSLYRHGRLVRSAIDNAREQIAHLVEAQASQVIFTSGGTESNNLAFMTQKPGSKFSISAIEHPSVSEPAENLTKQGHRLKLIKVDLNGCVSQEAIDDIVEYCPSFVSIMLANNETGVIQDIGKYAHQLTARGITVHTDAVQAVGKIPVSYSNLGVNMMTLSSHKIYGPKGIGALIVDKTVTITPIILGGGQEYGLRAGTENVSAIVGFGNAAELAALELAQRAEHMQKLNAILEALITPMPGIIIFAKEAKRLPNTSQFGLEGMDGEMILMELDRKGIAVSSGSACASGGGKPSSVLSAMGIKEELARSAIRVSLGKMNTEAEIIEFTNILKSLVSTG
jgi:cysteine desulfurase